MSRKPLLKGSASLLSLLAICLLQTTANAQTIRIVDSGTNTSIRGLSVVSDNIAWVSGSNGTIGRSIDGGRSWKWMIVPGYEKRDFRDIEAFDSLKAVIIAVGEPAVILRTSTGGREWNLVYENADPGMFLDAMDFLDEMNGIVIGDPIAGKMFLARTVNGGESWKDVPFENRPMVDSGEACFAASGTNIRMLSEDRYVFITGGMRSRFFSNLEFTELPLRQRTESSGANSVAVLQTSGPERIVVAGGDFGADTVATGNCALSVDGGKTFKTVPNPPGGYRSSVEFITDKKMIAAGTSGVDISEDGGRNWKRISNQGYHVARKAKLGKAVFLAGPRGRIALLVEN